MIPKKYILYPLLLFVAIFLIDKISLIPQLRDIGRRDSTPIENIVLNFLDLQKKHAKQSQFVEKKYYVFLGSSRSEFFEYIHPDSKAAMAYLASEQKKKIFASLIEPRGILRASDLWLHYVMLHTLLQSRVFPDYLVVEISPEMFNANSPHSMQVYVQNQTYDYKLLWDAFWLSQGKLRTEVLHRLLFASYAYGFRPEKALQNLLTGKNYLSKANLSLSLLKMRPRIQALPANAAAWTGLRDSTPQKVYEKQFIAYTKLMLESSILKRYKFSESEFNVLKKFNKLAQAKNLKVIYWTPKVHPNIQIEWRRLGVDKDFQRVQTWLKKSKAPYLDLQKTKLKCNLWADSSHLSDVCALEVFQKIIESIPNAK